MSKTQNFDHKDFNYNLEGIDTDNIGFLQAGELQKGDIILLADNRHVHISKVKKEIWSNKTGYGINVKIEYVEIADLTTEELKKHYVEFLGDVKTFEMILDDAIEVKVYADSVN